MQASDHGLIVNGAAPTAASAVAIVFAVVSGIVLGGLHFEVKLPTTRVRLPRKSANRSCVLCDMPCGPYSSFFAVRYHWPYVVKLN